MTDNVPSFDDELPRIREELRVPESFPPSVVAAAEEAAKRIARPSDLRAGRADYGIVPFVTIDPEGSLDLDQAFYAQPRGDGFIVLYAIADVGFFVDRGSPVEGEAWKRGVTLYSPDTQTLLYPEALSRGAASLLPGVERPAIVFSMELGADGRSTVKGVERAVIVSRAKLSYDAVSRHLAAERGSPRSGEFARSEWAESLDVLEGVGRLRQRLEAERGGVSLPIAAQHVEPWKAARAGYRLTLKDQEDVEGWNAQISLMTGIQAARLMIQKGVGLLRTLDPPRPDRLEALRLTARALGVPWPDDASYAEFIRSLDPANPLHSAVIFHAAGVMGGARYVAFEGPAPTGARHAAIAAYYAHVTAPLRRLADRYALDLLIELAAGRAPAGSVVSVLHALPAVMMTADRAQRTLESRMVDFAEARLLADRVGEVFEALVIRLRGDFVTVQIADPAVRADIPMERFGVEGGPSPRLAEDGSSLDVGDEHVRLGARLSVRLEAVDAAAGRVAFVPASA